MPDESESSNPDSPTGHPTRRAQKKPGRVRAARRRLSKRGYAEHLATSRTATSDPGVVFPDPSTLTSSDTVISDAAPPVGEAADLGFVAPGEGSPSASTSQSPSEGPTFTVPSSTHEVAITVTDDLTKASTDVQLVGSSPNSASYPAAAGADAGAPSSDDTQFAAERQADMDAMEATEADVAREESRRRALQSVLPDWGRTKLYWLAGLVALLAVIGIVVAVETLGGSSSPATSRSTTGQPSPSSHAPASGLSGAPTGGSSSLGPSSEGASSGLPTSQSGASQPSAPVITAQPQPRTCAAGGSVSVMVSVTGSPPPQIQWEKSVDGGKTWMSIQGATAPSWGQDCPSVPTQFRATVFNSSGSAVSNAVTVQPS